MPIKVCKDHSSRTLIEIYKGNLGKEESSIWTKRSLDMIEIIYFINESFKDTLIYGLTSHLRLVLLTENDTAAKWHIIVATIGDGEFHIEYKIPDRISPWPNGRLIGSTKNFEEAKKYLLIAMKECEAWQNNMELDKALSNLN